VIKSLCPSKIVVTTQSDNCTHNSHVRTGMALEHLVAHVLAAPLRGQSRLRLVSAA
jgi:hypothetical protein